MFSNAGKQFEKDFENSIVRCGMDMYYKREKDDMGLMRGVFNCYDFLMFYMDTLYLLELKSVKGGTLPYVNIGERKMSKETGKLETTYKRLEKLVHLSNVHGVKCGFLVEFRKSEEVYYIPAKEMFTLISQEGEHRKSVDSKFCKEHFIQIPRELAKVHYRYRIGECLDAMRGE